MAGRPATLRVDIVTDGSKANKGLDEVDSRLDKFGNKAKAVGKLAALGLAAGVAAAGAAAFKLAQGAAEDEKSAARLARTLKNTTGATDAQVAATERWITKQGKQLGVADDELRPALEKLTRATGDVGQAQKLTSLAMDVSAGTGKSLESVTTALAKAQNGSTGALGKLGVATKDAAGNALSLDQITQSMSTTFAGQASDAANTTAGKWERVKLQFAEAGETIGGKLLPIGAKLGEWVLAALPGLQRLGNQVGSRVGPAFAALGRFMVERVVPAGRALYEFFVNVIAPGFVRYVTPVIGGIRSAFGSLQASVQRNKPELEQIGRVLRQVAEFVATRVAPVIGSVLGGAFRTAGRIIGGIIDTIAAFTRAIGNAIDRVRSLIDWLSNIKVPKINLPEIPGLGAAALTTGAPSLLGGAPSYAPRSRLAGASLPGLARAAAGDAMLQLVGAGGVVPAGASVYIDRRDQSFHADVRADVVDRLAAGRLVDELASDYRRAVGRQP